MNWKSISFIVAAFAAGVGGGFFLARRGEVVETEVKHVVTRDTVVVRDTLRPKPVKVREYVTRTVRDTVVIERQLSDSAAIASLPIARRVYADPSYRAVVSGYRVQLDSMVLFPSREVVTEHIVVPCTVRVKPHFSLGLQVGYGTTDFQRLTPYVGVGLQWNWLTR